MGWEVIALSKKINIIEDDGKGLRINEQWTGEEKKEDNDKKKTEDDNKDEDTRD